MTLNEQLSPCPGSATDRHVRLPAERDCVRTRGHAIRDGESMLRNAVAAMMVAA